MDKDFQTARSESLRAVCIVGPFDLILCKRNVDPDV